MARPTKLTPEVRDRIVQAIRARNYAEQAARAAGISASTYYQWLERGGEASDGPHRELYEAVRRAEAEAEVHAVAVIERRWQRTGAPRSPTSSAATPGAGAGARAPS